MGYESFRKEFRARMGVSPGDYRIRRRIDRARELLTSTTQSVKEIAYELGYPNPSVFSLQFKREVGRSPEHYRSRGN
jgi:AraC-like DNA-binding protein